MTTVAKIFFWAIAAVFLAACVIAFLVALFGVKGFFIWLAGFTSGYIWTKL